MLIQRAGTGTIPPPGFPTPNYDALIAEWSQIPKPSTSTATLGPAQLVLGHDDSELDDLVPSLAALSPEERKRDVQEHVFGWDNESPRRVVEVGKFKVEWRPVTNGEYMAFWKSAGHGRPMPASWVDESGETKVTSITGCLCCRAQGI
jgi:L-histidine Nalpha-methyltransferase / hercynylcysteine S-oxide synthase